MVVEELELHDFWFVTFYWAGFTVPQRERAQEDFKVSYEATAPGSHNSFRIVHGIFYVPQNYQHSSNCETGTSSLSPSSEKTRKSNHLQHFLHSYLKTLSVCPVRVSNFRLLASKPGAQPSELPVRLWCWTRFRQRAFSRVYLVANVVLYREHRRDSLQYTDSRKKRKLHRSEA